MPILSVDPHLEGVGSREGKRKIESIEIECDMSSCVDIMEKNTFTLVLDMDQGLASGGDGSKQLAIHKKKKDWGRKPNGLYGWKVVQGP